MAFTQRKSADLRGAPTALNTDLTADMKAALAALDGYIATADTALHAAMQASAELSDLIDAASPVGPVAAFTYEVGPPDRPLQLIYTGAPADCVLFDWQWGDGTGESHDFPTTKKTFPAAGSYETTLTVTDAAGLTDTVSQTVVVGTPIPEAPVASFTYEPGAPNYPRQMVYTGAPADCVLFDWQWGDGTGESHTFTTTKKTFPADGTYVTTLTVTDAAGLQGTTSQSVVIGSQIPPIDPVDPPIDPGTDILAELPRLMCDTSMPSHTGTTISVPIGGDFQAALWNARPGDVIELANGGTWTANFMLPNYGDGSTDWVVIRPADMSKVPPEGARMTPAIAAAARLPILMSPNNQGAIMTDVGAHHFRFIAIEVSVDASIDNGGLCRMGSGAEATLGDLPHHFVFDRVYVHGTPTGNARRAIVLNCGWAAVIDSSITEMHEEGADSQCIAGWNGSGPFKIENNYLEAASENIMFGAGDPMIPGLVASDIEIRRNHISKKEEWQGEGWVVKNLLEMKAAIRVLMEANVLDSNWQDGQGGSAINFKSVNQGGTCPACGCEDLTFRYNVIHHTGSGFVLMGLDVAASRIMTRVTITNNVVFGINMTPDYMGDGRGFLILNNPADALIAHNSIFGCTNMAVNFGGPMDDPPTGLRIRDNIIDAGEYGVKGPGMGTKDVLECFPNFFCGNVIVGPGSAPVTEYPVGNYVAPNRNAVGFAPDWSLSDSSPYKGRGTDGLDPGADMAAVVAAVSGVVQSVPDIFVPR